MRYRERRGTHLRVLCWLLAALALAGFGLFPGGHCVSSTTTDTNVAAAVVTDPATHWRHQSEDDDAHPHGWADAGADDCRLRPASIGSVAVTAATVTTAAEHPPSGVSAVPASPPSALRKPRMRSARPLTDIGISRT